MYMKVCSIIMHVNKKVIVRACAPNIIYVYIIQYVRAYEFILYTGVH